MIASNNPTNPENCTFPPKITSITQSKTNLELNNTNQRLKNFAGLIFWLEGYINCEPSHFLNPKVQKVSACRTKDANITVDADFMYSISV